MRLNFFCLASILAKRELEKTRAPCVDCDIASSCAIVSETRSSMSDISKAIDEIAMKRLGIVEMLRTIAKLLAIFFSRA